VTYFVTPSVAVFEAVTYMGKIHVYDKIMIEKPEKKRKM